MTARWCRLRPEPQLARPDTELMDLLALVWVPTRPTQVTIVSGRPRQHA